jgi:hypothetical protein
MVGSFWVFGNTGESSAKFPHGKPPLVGAGDILKPSAYQPSWARYRCRPWFSSPPHLISTAVRHGIDQGYVRFFLDFNRRRADNRLGHKANIIGFNDNRLGEWTAIAWSLERAKPELYCVKSRIDQAASKKLNQIFQYLFDMGDLPFRAQLAEHLQAFPEVDVPSFGDPSLGEPEL